MTCNVLRSVVNRLFLNLPKNLPKIKNSEAKVLK